MGGELDVTATAEVEAVVSGGGDEGRPGLLGGVGDGIELGFPAGAVAGGEIDDGAEREGDDVGVVGDGVVDAFEDPAKEAGGLTVFALGGEVVACGGGEAFEDFDVEQRGLRGYADGVSGSNGAEGE